MTDRKSTIAMMLFTATLFIIVSLFTFFQPVPSLSTVRPSAIELEVVDILAANNNDQTLVFTNSSSLYVTGGFTATAGSQLSKRFTLFRSRRHRQLVINGIFLEIKKIVHSFLSSIKSLTRAFATIKPKIPGTMKSPHGFNDHIEIDIRRLSLSSSQLKRVLETYQEVVRIGGETIVNKAKNSGLDLTPHLVYRYFAAVDWGKDYNGKT